jgi:hypothetical protein
MQLCPNFYLGANLEQRGDPNLIPDRGRYVRPVAGRTDTQLPSKHSNWRRVASSARSSVDVPVLLQKDTIYVRLCNLPLWVY